MAHMNELSTLSNLFSDDIKLRSYFVAKIFPFSLKGATKTWFNNLSPGSLNSPIAFVNAFFQKYFEQGKGEILPESWARFCSLIRALPKEPLPKNKLLDIFYNGLTDESKTYLDSCTGCVFRERTPAEAEELMVKIS
jgi:hypothetical protein